jgi:hypothetical protein
VLLSCPPCNQGRPVGCPSLRVMRNGNASALDVKVRGASAIRDAFNHCVEV